MVALARLAALRQQAASAQSGFAALSVSAALSLGQQSLHQNYDHSRIQNQNSLAKYQLQQSHSAASPAGQSLKHSASQPPLSHGYVASAQPELVEEDLEVCVRLVCIAVLVSTEEVCGHAKAVSHGGMNALLLAHTLDRGCLPLYGMCKLIAPLSTSSWKCPVTVSC